MPKRKLSPKDVSQNEAVLEALRKFVREEPEAVARLLAMLSSGIKAKLVIHEHKAAAENGFDPGQRREWSLGPDYSEQIEPDHAQVTGYISGYRHSGH